jgi:hypothetical protein
MNYRPVAVLLFNKPQKHDLNTAVYLQDKISGVVNETQGSILQQKFTRPLWCYSW